MFTIDPKNQASTAQNERKPSPVQAEGLGSQPDISQDEYEWLLKARDAYQSSTSYMDSNLRKKWENGLRAFNNLHPMDSKYSNSAYDKRSKLFRPKIRTIERKNEAAAAAAFFSNMDVTSITARDPTDSAAVANADVMTQLLQYRLTESIKWFMLLLGAFQDTQTMGACVGHIYWDYEAEKSDVAVEIEDGRPEQNEDEYPVQHDLPDGAFAVEDDDDEPEQGMGLSSMPAPLPGAMQGPEFQHAAPPPQMGGSEMLPPAMPAPSMEAPKPSPMGNQPPAQMARQAVQPQQSKKRSPRIDRPVIELVPIENIRIDPGSDWTDPIHSSPYVIHIIPVYYMDVKTRMESGEWYEYGEGFIKAAATTGFDSTRLARQNGADPYNLDGKTVSEYEVVWVQRHIHRKDGVDWEFYTLSDLCLLSEPKLLSETVLHGMRPYEMGCCVVEAHRAYPSSIAELGKDLQSEANELANQRIDNVKFVLNKKYLVKRGEGQDLSGLVRNVPGGVVMVNNVDDVKELTWPDVTASGYEEQSRIDNDLNELLGNFSAAQVMADHGVNGPARNMALLGQSAGTLVEYILRTFTETWVQPILRQLVKMEQAYETDEVILALAGKKADLFKKYGVEKVTDDLLDKDLTLAVNVGMGATDPQMKLQKFIAGMTAFANVAKEPPMGLNMQEVGKEIFGHLGYSDGSRFFTNDNPQVAQLQNQLQQAMQMIQKLKAGNDVKMAGHQVKVQTTESTNKTRLAIAQQHEDSENMRTATGHQVTLVDADKQRTHELTMSTFEKRHQHSVNKINHEHETMTMRDGDDKNTRSRK